MLALFLSVMPLFDNFAQCLPSATLPSTTHQILKLYTCFTVSWSGPLLQGYAPLKLS